MPFKPRERFDAETGKWVPVRANLLEEASKLRENLRQKDIPLQKERDWRRRLREIERNLGEDGGEEKLHMGESQYL